VRDRKGEKRKGRGEKKRKKERKTPLSRTTLDSIVFRRLPAAATREKRGGGKGEEKEGKKESLQHNNLLVFQNIYIIFSNRTSPFAAQQLQAGTRSRHSCVKGGEGGGKIKRRGFVPRLLSRRSRTRLRRERGTRGKERKRKKSRWRPQCSSVPLPSSPKLRSSVTCPRAEARPEREERREEGGKGEKREGERRRST